MTLVTLFTFFTLVTSVMLVTWVEIRAGHAPFFGDAHRCAYPNIPHVCAYLRTHTWIYSVGAIWRDRMASPSRNRDSIWNWRDFEVRDFDSYWENTSATSWVRLNSNCQRRHTWDTLVIFRHSEPYNEPHMNGRRERKEGIGPGLEDSIPDSDFRRDWNWCVFNALELS